MKIGPYLKLTRFPLVFTAIADSATGYLITIGGRRPDPATLGVLALASACLYACGMVLNDVADAVIDRERHPERPIPSGQVSVRAARTFGMALSFTAVVATAVLHYPLAIAALATWVVILAYNFVLKEKGSGGAASMALARFCNFSMGIVAAGIGSGRMWELPPGAPWREAAVLGIYVFFLTRVSQAEESLFPRWSTLLGGFGMLFAVGVAWGQGSQRFGWAIASAGALAATLVALLIAAATKPEKASIMKLVLWSVIGIIVLDATFLLGRGALEAGGSVAALLVPVLISRPVFRHL